MNTEIEIINKIIVEAVEHGSDAGGSYNSNEENLINVVKEWLKFKGLSSEYVVNRDVEVLTRYRTVLNVPQIVSIIDEDLTWLEDFK